MKLHFLTSVLFAIAITIMAISDKLITRLLLMVASLVLFHATLIIFGIEYDQVQSRILKKSQIEAQRRKL